MKERCTLYTFIWPLFMLRNIINEDVFIFYELYLLPYSLFDYRLTCQRREEERKKNTNSVTKKEKQTNDVGGE
jgi:hypothetical protein